MVLHTLTLATSTAVFARYLQTSPQFATTIPRLPSAPTTPVHATPNTTWSAEDMPTPGGALGGLLSLFHTKWYFPEAISNSQV